MKKKNNSKITVYKRGDHEIFSMYDQRKKVEHKIVYNKYDNAIYYIYNSNNVNDNKRIHIKNERSLIKYIKYCGFSEIFIDGVNNFLKSNYNIKLKDIIPDYNPDNN